MNLVQRIGKLAAGLRRLVFGHPHRILFVSATAPEEQWPSTLRDAERYRRAGYLVQVRPMPHAGTTAPDCCVVCLFATRPAGSMPRRQASADNGASKGAPRPASPPCETAPEFAHDSSADSTTPPAPAQPQTRMKINPVAR